MYGMHESYDWYECYECNEWRNRCHRLQQWLTNPLPRYSDKCLLDFCQTKAKLNSNEISDELVSTVSEEWRRDWKTSERQLILDTPSTAIIFKSNSSQNS